MSIRRPAAFTLPGAVVCLLSVAILTGCGGSGVSSLAPGTSSSVPSGSTAPGGSLVASVKTIVGLGVLAVDSPTHAVYVLAPHATQPSLVVVDDSTNKVKSTINLSGKPSDYYAD